MGFMTRLLFILLLLAVTRPGAAQQLPPRPIDARQGIQSERGLIIADERGRHLMRDTAPNPRATPYLYFTFANGTLTGTNSVLDTSGNARDGTTANGLSLIAAGLIGYGSQASNADVQRIAATTDFFGTAFTVRWWMMITNWSFARWFNATPGGIDSPNLSFMTASAGKGSSYGVGAANRQALGDLRLLLFSTNFSGVPLEATNAAGSKVDSLVLSNWYHLVVTYDGSNLILYQQGVAVCGANTAYNVSGSGGNHKLQWGGDFGDFGATWNGKLDEIGVWNDRCWSAAQVLSDYNSGTGQTYP